MADESKKEKLKEMELELVSSMNFKELTNKIAEFIYNYTLRTRFHYSKEHPKVLGNVSFWLEQKGEQIILMYNVHPKDWGMNKIAYDFEVEEKRFYDHIWAGNNKNYNQY